MTSCTRYASVSDQLSIFYVSFMRQASVSSVPTPRGEKSIFPANAHPPDRGQGSLARSPIPIIRPAGALLSSWRLALDVRTPKTVHSPKECPSESPLGLPLSSSPMPSPNAACCFINGCSSPSIHYTYSGPWHLAPRRSGALGDGNLSSKSRNEAAPAPARPLRCTKRLRRPLT